MQIKSPNNHIAKFIHQSEKKHMKFFKRYFEDLAEVSIEPDEYSIHLQAKNEVLMHNRLIIKESYDMLVGLCLLVGYQPPFLRVHAANT